MKATPSQLVKDIIKDADSVEDMALRAIAVARATHGFDLDAQVQLVDAAYKISDGIEDPAKRIDVRAQIGAHSTRIQQQLDQRKNQK